MKQFARFAPVLIFLIAFSALFSAQSFDQVITIDAGENDSLCIHAFFNFECPQCLSVQPFIESLEEKHRIELRTYNIQIEEDKNIYNNLKELYDITAAGFPVVFVGDNYIVGEESIRKDLEPLILECLEKGCYCPVEKIRGTIGQMPRRDDFTPEQEETIDLPFFGEIDIEKTPLVVLTALIAFVDGFNPCSVWVLLFLLGIVIHSGSRKRIFLIGLTFLIVTASVYGLFMLALLNVLLYVRFLFEIRVIVALIAVLFALVNIKDFFWYKKGISFTIPDSYKPKIFKNVRNIMHKDSGLAATLIGTIILALGVALVELPCTAGLPLIWTNIMAVQDLPLMAFAGLFSLYILIYLGIELSIFFGAVITMKQTHFEEKHGRLLKLIGGCIMLALALTIVFAYELMEDIGASMLIFGSAILAAIIIAFVYNRVVGLK